MPSTYHVLECYYSGTTNFRGSKVIIKSARFEQYISIPYDYRKNNSLDIAIMYLKENGFKISGYGESSKGYYIVTTTFKGLKK